MLMLPSVYGEGSECYNLVKKGYTIIPFEEMARLATLFEDQFRVPAVGGDVLITDGGRRAVKS